MKYGYMFYRKPLNPGMKSRVINYGDPIQSYAVKNLYREMGIPEEDIIPVPRYDIANYDGERCVCIVNLASVYEEVIYNSHFMPPSPKLLAIPYSVYINREIPEDELNYYRTCGGVGCRDMHTVEFLKKQGVDAYLTGCLTLTLPRRSEEIAAKADKIYIIDGPSSLIPFIPEEIKKNAVYLSNITRYVNSEGKSDRISEQDAYKFHAEAEERINLLKNTAKLVITSRLHVASPCLAMGIPIILAKSYLGDRFGFIDRLIHVYNEENFDKIDWNPAAVDIEAVKEKIKQNFFDRVKAAASRFELEKIWSSKNPKCNISYETDCSMVIKKIKTYLNQSFKYAVWGLALPKACYLYEAIKEQYPEARLVNGIDIAITQPFFGAETIRPDEIAAIDKEVIIFVTAPSAQEPAKKLLENTGRRFVLIKSTTAECFNF